MLTGWHYRPKRPPAVILAWRLRHWLTTLRPAPAHVILRTPVAAPRWTLFFAFCPNGTASADQIETLHLLGRVGRPICVVCASPEPEVIPHALREGSQALLWKGLSGWDFSGYAAGLWAIAQFSAGADVFVMNDSVAGPFGEVRSMVDNAPWALTGFTGSGIAEDHVQTYAFNLADVTPARLHALRGVLLPAMSFKTFGGVVACQETRLARVASRSMSVGAYWYDRGDPAISEPFLLAEQGYPFVKRSLHGKLANRFDAAAVEQLLARQRSLTA